MSKLLEEQAHFLELLQTTSKQQRKALLQTIDKLQLKALSEIAHNIIKKTIVLTPEDKKKLKKHKKIITLLGRKTAARRDKVRALQRTPKAITLLLNSVDPQLWRK